MIMVDADLSGAGRSVRHACSSRQVLRAVQTCIHLVDSPAPLLPYLTRCPGPHDLHPGTL